MRTRLATMVVCAVGVGFALLSLKAYPQAVPEGDPVLKLDPARYGVGDLVAALEQLERYRPPQAYDRVVPLLSHPEPLVVRTAAWLLRRMDRNVDAVAAVGAVLANAASTDAQRLSVAIALGELRADASAAPLRSALANDAVPEVRAAAAQALGALHRVGSASALGVALSSDSDPSVRQAAAEALGPINDQSADSESLSILLSALNDSDALVRKQVVWAIGRQHAVAATAVGNLLGVLQNDADCRVQSAAAWALSQLGNMVACDALISATQGTCRSTAQAATWARIAMGCP